jgi:hypothetical protein
MNWFSFFNYFAITVPECPNKKAEKASESPTTERTMAAVRLCRKVQIPFLPGIFIVIADTYHTNSVFRKTSFVPRKNNSCYAKLISKVAECNEYSSVE